MKAYTIHNYWLCQITGQVNTQLSFELNEGLKVFDKNFPNKDYADAYINKSKRDWFLSALEKFINHKKKIIESSNDVTKHKALSVCLAAYEEFSNKSLENITKRFINGKQYFEAIIPNPQNNSYTSSLDNFKELIKFCETEIKGHGKI